MMAEMRYPLRGQSLPTESRSDGVFRVAPGEHLPRSPFTAEEICLISGLCVLSWRAAGFHAASTAVYSKWGSRWFLDGLTDRTFQADGIQAGLVVRQRRARIEALNKEISARRQRA